VRSKIELIEKERVIWWRPWPNFRTDLNLCFLRDTKTLFFFFRFQLLTLKFSPHQSTLSRSITWNQGRKEK